MRKVNNIVFHCTATQPGATVKSIQKYWREVQGWKSPGYHYIIDANGIITQLADVEQITNGVQGHNKDSVHISYIGGVDKFGMPADTRTAAQLVAMRCLLQAMKGLYPNARVLGHRDFPGVAKACPSFDVKKWLEKEKL